MSCIKKFIKIISVIVIIAMAMTFLPSVAYADGEERTIDISGSSTESQKRYLFMNKSVQLNPGDTVNLQFTPQYSAEYTMTVTGRYNSNGRNLHAFLYDENKKMLVDNDNADLDHNVTTMTYNMKAGKTYYYVIKHWMEAGSGATAATAYLDFTSAPSDDMAFDGFTATPSTVTVPTYDIVSVLSKIKLFIQLRGNPVYTWKYDNGNLSYNGVDIIVNALNCNANNDINTLDIYYMGMHTSVDFKVDTTTTTTTKPTTTTTTTTTTPTTTTTTTKPTTTTTTTTTKPTTTTTTTTTKPTTTVNTTVKYLTLTSRTTSSISFKWTAISGASKYQAYCKNNTTGKVNYYYFTGNSGKISGLTNANSYTVKVRALVNGKYMAYSNYLTYHALPGKVSGVKNSSYATTSVTVKWNKMAGADGYYVYKYSPSTKKTTKIATVSSSKTYYKVSGLKSGTSYYYYVAAYTKDTQTKIGSKSSRLSTVTKPSKVSLSSVKNTGKKKISVKWKKATATGYEIQYSTKKNFSSDKKTVTVKSYKTVSKTISLSKSKRTYYVRVRAYKTVGSKKVYGSYSTVKSVKSK